MIEAKVYWITGLSGAGKTTIGRLLVDKLKKSGQCVVYLDGDILRDVLGSTASHTIGERKELAMYYSRMCKMMVDQDFTVVCATISMFNDVRDWNRENIPGYVEVYLKVPIEVLIERDQKQLYSRAKAGEISNVMGLDVEVDEPQNPDVTLINDGSNNPASIIETLWDLLD
jgi:cytidine diphosphoramidate kinase